VVVHRAEAAHTTALEVDRLLTATPTDTQSTWPAATQLAPELISATQEELSLHPHYEGKRLHVVPALIWARSLSSSHNAKASNPSLLTAIAPQLGTGYQSVVARIDKLAQLELEVDRAKEACKASSTSPDAERACEARVEALEARRGALEASIEPARVAFAQSCRAAASTVPPELKDLYGVALVNLRQAVDDAHLANGAAVLRYPHGP
jgi:hypothetical protein